MLKFITPKYVENLENELSKIFSAVIESDVPVEVFARVTDSVSKIGVDFDIKSERIFGSLAP